MGKHIYILDTCVLLHDPHAIYKFQENDIYIPLAVIDDLDEIKTRREPVGWSAREVFRNLDKFSVNDLVRGVKVTPQSGKLYVSNIGYINPNEKPNIVRQNSDNVLIDTCLQLKNSFPKRKVCLVTKDTSLRIRAAAYNIVVENYKHDMIDTEFYQGYVTVDVFNKDLFDSLYNQPVLNIDEARKLLGDEALPVLYPNQFCIFKNNDLSLITICKNNTLVNCFPNKNKLSFMGISPKNLEQKMSTYLLNDDSIPLVCLSGKAGTGKSICTLAVALQKHTDGIFDKIVVIKPMVPVGGKDIGYLPGDKFSKISAWLGPVKDNIEQLVTTGFPEDNGKGFFEEMCEKDIIEVEAMAFIQGRSIPNAFILVEEVENMSPREARMVVERCGKGSKVALIGDLTQIENPYLDQYSCGLTHAIQGGKTNELVGSIHLKKVERSALAAVATDIFRKGFDY
jgi:PhoH-like ATPase